MKRVAVDEAAPVDSQGNTVGTGAATAQARRRLERFSESEWKGNGELWMDPAGNSAIVYDCRLDIGRDAIHYTWIYEDEEKAGSFTFNDDGAIWVDSWHQPSAVQCFNAENAWAIFSLKHEYEVPDNPNWGWRSTLSQRPDGSLVLQMTNIAPWGEEARAVRMVFSRGDT